MWLTSTWLRILQRRIPAERATYRRHCHLSTTGSNSLDVSKGVKEKMQELSESFPSGIHYSVTLDTTDVIHASVDEVLVTFLETTLLVVLVIFLFLQNWRAVIIPCITIPVSLIGTLAVMALFGFSINTLTLFRTDTCRGHCGG